ncbi:MAG: TIGR03936 family radical SAM-associated protein [Lachnospiraceae bacterium]|nr:TIGR03936 family radical SAM-associated protein [Lachnospiraceae bacterium]
MKLRVKFRKYGALKFISHLDVMRFFQKALRRAEIDVAYTTGFSPHQIMSFAAPLGLGQESNGEYVDIEVNTPISSQDFIERFNACSAEGIEVTDVRLLPEKAVGAMASVTAAEYRIRFREGRAPVGDWQYAFEQFMSQDEILFEKKTKKSTSVVNLKEGILDWRLEENCVWCILSTGSVLNIRPDAFLEAFFAYLKQDMPQNALLITREETYGKITDPVTLEEKRLPLADFGIWVAP